MRFECLKAEVFLRLYNFGSNPWSLSVKNWCVFSILLLRWQPFRTKRRSSVKNWCVFWDFTTSVATLSREMKFECQKLMFFCDFTSSAATFSHETRFERQKSKSDGVTSSAFARNEVQVSKADGFFFAILHPRRQRFRTKWGSSVKNWLFFATLVGPVVTLPPCV